MLFKPRRTIDDTETKWGLCLWRLPNGRYIEDGEGRYLTAGPCEIGNPITEHNMTRAAISLGVTEGSPFWLPGFRKISDNEHDDQMERLLDGKVPDAVDLYHQSIGENG